MTPTGQTTQSIKTNSDAIGRKPGKVASEADPLSSIGFDALFANAMVAGQDKRVSQGLEQALQSTQGAKPRQSAQPPVGLSRLNGVASAVQAAVSAQKQQDTASVGVAASTAAQANNGSSKPAQATSAPAQTPASQVPEKPAQAQANEGNTATAAKEETTTAEPKQTQAEVKSTAPAKDGIPLDGTGMEPVTEEEAQVLASTLKPVKAGAEAETTKPNAVATAATSKDVNSPVIKPENSVAGKAADSAEMPAEFKQEVKQNNSERSVKVEAQELAASRGPADKADPKAVAAVRSEAAVNATTRPDANPQAVAVQSAGQMRSLKSGDEKLVTSGIEGKSNASAQGLASMSPQASLRTGSAAQAEVKTPVNQPGFAKELGQKITWAIGKNLSTVDIRVNPEQMGTLNMRIMQRGQNIQLIIRTSDETSGAMLQQAISGLKETLGQNGLQLNQVQIHSGNNPNGAQSQFGQNMQGQSQQQGGAQQQSSGGQGQGQQTATAEPDAAVTQSVRPQSPDSNLDLFA